MLSSFSHFKNPANLTLFRYYGPFLLFLLIETSHGVAIAARQMGFRDDSLDDSPTHLNFFRSSLRGRQRVLSCANNPNVCLDHEKNPWGGITCCFQQLCKDTLRDSNHCGVCGRACGYGFVCCDGKCVDIQNDSNHCGSCFEECPGKNRCVYAMCDYGS